MLYLSSLLALSWLSLGSLLSKEIQNVYGSRIFITKYHHHHNSVIMSMLTFTAVSPLPGLDNPQEVLRHVVPALAADTGHGGSSQLRLVKTLKYYDS